MGIERGAFPAHLLNIPPSLDSRMRMIGRCKAQETAVAKGDSHQQSPSTLGELLKKIELSHGGGGHD